MDLRQLRYFLAVAEAGGFSRAAERAYVAQPALSAHVSRLEDELGVQLFVRSSKGVELTHAGVVLVEHAHELFRFVQLTQAAVRHAGEAVHGDVSVGLPHTVAAMLTLPLLQAVRARWPRVSLRLVEAHSGWLLEWLLSGRLDVAVLFGGPPTKGLQMQPLLDEALYLISPPGVVAAGDRVALRDIAGLPLLLPAAGHGLRLAIDRAAAAAGIGLRIDVEMDALASIRKAVAAGLGHTILSRAAVDEELRQGRVEARRIVEPVVMRTVVLAMRESQLHGAARDKVADEIRAQIVRLVADGRWPAELRVPVAAAGAADADPAITKNAPDVRQTLLAARGQRP